MRGIGGREPALRKRVDFLQFDAYQWVYVKLDFGYPYGHTGINGLVGLDILERGRFIIDLDVLCRSTPQESKKSSTVKVYIYSGIKWMSPDSMNGNKFVVPAPEN